MTDDPRLTPSIENPEDDFQDDEPALTRRRLTEDSELDMTPMIDCVFLLLIFFTVTSKADQATSVELPPARHGKGVSEQSSVIITLAQREGNRPAAVYLGNGTAGSPLSEDPKDMEAAVTAAVEKGFLQEAKTAVILKAARLVKHRDVSVVAKAVGRADVEDVKLHIAVFETE
jgi:biopolymer transport protein ExbD